ncbi:MAG: hypothetical protein QXQ40_02210 [Candidatus Aenigmatarchaeota archaeon]
MNEFIAWLGVGLAIMVLLFVFFGGYYQVIPIKENITTTTTTLPETINGRNVMLVGPKAVEVWRTVEFKELNTSYGSEEIIYSIADNRLFNGLLFGANKIEIKSKVDLKTTIGAYLSFDVKDTNSYGSLIIKVNGNTINQSRFEIGNHKLIINKSLLKEENIIEVIPTSSNWKIWAPTVYDLKNMQFVHQELYSHQNSFSFIVYEAEYNSLVNKHGKILLDLTERRGRLKIILNGKEVFSGEVERSTKAIDFDQSYLKLGENSIEFVAEDGRFQGYAGLTLYFYTIKENVAEKTFMISSSAYSNLHKNPGTISFTVTKVLNPGGLSLTLEDENKITHHISYERVEEKTYNYSLSPSQCSVGYNHVKIKSIDNGVFYIKDLEIKLS